MDKDFNAIIVNKEIFTIDDAREAAKQLFEVQVEDFNELKNEKWYKHLLNAITFGADRKKQVIKNIRSLSKLQTIFMKVYYENYKGLDAQLNEIIDNLTKTNESVKRLYINYIVGIRPQHSILELSALEQDILLLLLCAYLSNSGNEEDLRKYRAGVAQTIGRGMPQGNFKPEMLEQVKSGEIFYRYIVEMCAIDDGLSDFSVPDNVYEAIEYLTISPRAKREIEKSVGDELNAFGKDYLVAKYGTAEINLLDDDVELTSEDTVILRPDEIEEEKEDENITCSLQIKKGEVKEFRNKNVHISAIIQCEGELIFKNCTIYYNESHAKNEIHLMENAKLSIIDSKVICKGLSEEPFVKDKHENTIVFENTIFEDCSYFFSASSYNLIMFSMCKCKLHNCYTDFLDLHVIEDTVLKIADNIIVQDNVSIFQKIKNLTIMIKVWDGSTVNSSNKEIINNTVIEKESFKKICEKEHGIIYFDVRRISIEKCSFYGMTEGIHAFKVKDCKFENCNRAINCMIMPSNHIKDRHIANCVFIKCTNVIDVCDDIIISNCYFISCYNTIISPAAMGFFTGGIKVKFCYFINIKNLSSNNARMGYEQDASSIVFRRSGTNNSMANYLEKCIFDGVSIDNNFLIAATGSVKPSGTVMYIEDCDFRNCKTNRKSGKIIKEYLQYNNLFGKTQDFHANIIINCSGLDKINAEGTEAKDEVLKAALEMAVNIGSKYSAKEAEML